MQWMIKVKLHSCVQELIVSDLIICWTSYHTRAALSCDMMPHKQTWSDTSSCSTHSCGFPIFPDDTFSIMGIIDLVGHFIHTMYLIGDSLNQPDTIDTTGWYELQFAHLVITHWCPCIWNYFCDTYILLVYRRMQNIRNTGVLWQNQVKLLFYWKYVWIQELLTA